MSDDNKEHVFNQQKAIEWVSKKWVSKKCECCGSSNWNVADFMVSIPTFNGGMIIGGKTVPLFQVICANCGYVRLVSALMANVIHKKEGENG